MTSFKHQLSEGQRRFAEFGIENVLLVAPAGCGKTEALAARTESFVVRELVSPPRKILALTFSNKATANLAARLRATLGIGWSRNVDVMNLHGFSARIISAHGKMVGLNPDLIMPDKVWYKRTLNSVGVDFSNSSTFERVMRVAKSGAVDDDVVMQRLHDSGNFNAISFEQVLRDENRLDFDDLLRHGRRILNVKAVRELYREHFSVVLIDEVQDLTWDQFELVQAVGDGRASYAGDPAQGIYAFRGAEPNRIFSAIEESGTETISLTECHRSSPAVLNAINAIAKQMGTTILECSNPERFVNGGIVASLVSDDPNDESVVLVNNAERIVANNPLWNIGFVVRRGTRLNALRRELGERGLRFEDWTAPTHVPQIVELLHQNVVSAEEASIDVVDQLLTLESLCAQSMETWDIDLRGELAAACEEVGNMVNGGMTLREAVATCKRADDIDSPVGVGFHLLNAHVGKGQEFDWVVVIGLEDGHIPDFRAKDEVSLLEEMRTLHVMISRAKTGLTITMAERTDTRFGLRNATPSRWWDVISATSTEDWT